jgi:hypothetical protein
VFDHSLNNTGLYSWHGKSSVEPQITLNSTNRSVSSFWGPKRLGLHPGTKGATSVVRWSAPREGDYKIRGRFYRLDPKGNTDVAVLLVERQLFAARITAAHNSEAFAFDLHFDEDDTIDFSVGLGSDKSYRGDATGLEVSIVSKSS